MNSSRLSLFCNRALEAGWLLGITITPVFFNVYSSRVFEPDKLTSLRALATIMAVLWLTRFLDEKLRGENPLRFSWRTPMVLPALLTVVVYLISSVFSLVPYTSILGSYQRLQGTYTLFGYLVIFFCLITTLRTRLQLSRLLTVLILNSLPISLYGIIQHNGLDPLPWAGDVKSRVASNMGNAIFVAAYMIMIVPLTAARIIESFNDILGRAEARLSDILRASGYIFVIAVQLLTIWYSQSRGPWLGIVAAAFFFPFLAFIVLLRQSKLRMPEEPGDFSDILKGLGFGIGSLLVVGLLAAVVYYLGSLVMQSSSVPLYLGGGLAALSFVGLWLYFVVERKGWRWLWISWGMIGLCAALFMIFINIPGPIQNMARKVDALQRLTTITELQSGTGKVRGLIWQGAVELLLPHEPLSFPDGKQDNFNALRPLVGYGPESMYVAYNAFYPPELGHYESRTASPDRSHNETLDSLIITGMFGFLTYLFTFGSIFYWGFKWLGLLQKPAKLLLYCLLDLVMAAIFFVIAWRLEGVYLFAVAIPLGILSGTMLYLTIEALLILFRNTESAETDASALEESEGPLVNFELGLHPHSVLIIAILSAVMAHFVEINFGIAIASTRTTFWALAGLLVVLGLQWITDEKPALNGSSGASGKASGTGRRSSKTSQLLQPWLSSVLALSFSSAFLLGTLAFDFINNPQRLAQPLLIFLESLTVKYTPTLTNSYGALMIFLFTWVLFGVIGLSEFDREGLFRKDRKGLWLKAIMFYVIISLSIWFVFGISLAETHADLVRNSPTSNQNTSMEALVASILSLDMDLAGLLSHFYFLIFATLAGIGLVLVWEEKIPQEWGSLLSFSTMLLLLIASYFVIKPGCYDLISADIIYKNGSAFANNSEVIQKEIGIAHYEKALELAPHEDYYNLFLGKAYLELTQGYPVNFSALSEDQQQAFITDWQNQAGDALAEEQLAAQILAWEEEQVNGQAINFLKTEDVLMHAREINPLNTDHSANLARFYKSWAARVSLDMRAEGLSDAQLADLQTQYDTLLQQSLENYQIALTLSPNNPIIWNELAQLYAGDFKDMIKFHKTITQSIEVDDGFEQTWMLLGDMYSSRGDALGAIDSYQKALDVKRGFAQHCTVRRVLGSLQVQQSLWEDAEVTLDTAVERCATSSDLWDIYRFLAIIYANQERPEEAMAAALQALELAPESQQPLVEQLITALQPQPEPVEP